MSAQDASVVNRGWQHSLASLSCGLATVQFSAMLEGEELSTANTDPAKKKQKNTQRDCSDWSNEHENTVCTSSRPYMLSR